MAETKKTTKKPRSSLIGNQAKPVVLDSTTKLDIDTNKVLIDNIIEAGLQSKLILEHLINLLLSPMQETKCINLLILCVMTPQFLRLSEHILMTFVS